MDVYDAVVWWVDHIADANMFVHIRASLIRGQSSAFETYIHEKLYMPTLVRVRDNVGDELHALFREADSV